MISIESLREYQKVADTTAIYPKRLDKDVLKDTGGILYTVLGLVGECGEFMDLFLQPGTIPRDALIK